ncbi:MAG: hypothetical protein JWN08_2181 [Frankiales bacterium]|nr:hypothetical protein [Frankiales bacterium]
MRHRLLSAAVAASALVAGVGAVAVAPATAATPAIRVLAAFPDDSLTVPDRTQLTGRRVALPLVDCATRVTSCDVTRLIDQLDGFDLDPRMSVTFSRPVDPVLVAANTVVEKVRGTGPALVTGVDRVAYDAAHASVFMHPSVQLAPSTTYRLRVRPVGGLPNVNRTFTTMSATIDLRRMVGQLDSGLAYDRAGIAADARGLVVDQAVPAAGTVLGYTADRGPATATVTTTIPNISGTGVGSYVFGSYLAPSWLTSDKLIPQTPTGGSGPSVRGQERLPFVLLVPAGTPPTGGWPVAVFGHGFTRSATDVFLAASQNATRGLATIATHVVGHGFGAGSEWRITREGVTTTTPAYGRGTDQDGNGLIESSEGVSTPGNPGRLGAVNSRDGLRQTVVDVSALVRAVGRGTPAAPLASTGTTYYGQSFGGIYGTMLGGADPRVQRLALNVPGGPITEIARLSPAFRPLTTQALGNAVPQLLNGGDVGFTESMPLPGDPPVTAPAPGALAIQEYLGLATWLTRSGNPETYAPLLRATPPGGRASATSVLFQVALGDQTVPNPTSRTLIAAGGLFDRTSLYRNDKTGQASRNPHGFLLDPSFTAGALAGQGQIVEFLLTARTIDPDGAADIWEVPISDPGLLRNLHFTSPLHP